MRWRNYIGSACLLLSLVFARAEEDRAFVCDPSKPNQGCSDFGRCDVPLLQCQCNPGFLGDGKKCDSVCTTVKETCTSDKQTVSCIDLPMTSTSHSCLCKKGYFWSQAGMKCYDVDECQLRKCKPFSVCKNEPGSYSCECCYSKNGWKGISGFGYIGDGESRCYPDSILEFGKSDYLHKLEKDGAIHSTFPGGFPFFGELYHDVYTHLDGYVTFGTRDAPYLGGDAFPTHRHVKFIAPFWTDLEVSSEPGSGLYVDGYSMFKPYGSPIESVFPNKMRGFIDEINLPGFSPSVMYVATWANMTVSGGNLPKGQKARITFQIAMATNGTHSFGFSSYAEDPRDSEWDAPLDNVYIGLSGENFATRLPVDKFSQLFDDPEEGTTGCEKLSFLTQRGRKYAVFGPPFVQNNNAKCIDEASIQGHLHAGFEVESEDNEGHLLPPELFCPCLEQQAYADDRFVETHLEKAPVYDPPVIDRHSCHMSRFYKDIHTDAKDYRARAYCCYDSKGALLTKGPGAGAIVPEGHEDEVKKLRKLCCVDADLCDVFHRMYHPVSCHRYDRPALAFIRGAGHFDVLNSTKYTFSGRGEYTFLDLKRAGAAKIQIRMVDETVGKFATSFITAVALKCRVPRTPTSEPIDMAEHIAEVRVNKEQKLELVVDGQIADGAFPEEVKTTFITGCTAEYCQVVCKYQKYVLALRAYLRGRHLHITTTLPRLGAYSPLGLVGSNTGHLVFGMEETTTAAPTTTTAAPTTTTAPTTTAAPTTTEAPITTTDAPPTTAVTMTTTTQPADTVVPPRAIERAIVDAEVTDLNDDKQLRLFGEYYRIKSAESLFNYSGGETWDTYNKDGDKFKPTYFSELKFNYDTMDSICHCEGDRACQYDQLTTGNKDVSTATLNAGKSFAADRNAFAARTPMWDINPYLVLDVHQLYQGNLQDFVQYDEMHTHVDNPEPMIPDGFELTTNFHEWQYDLDKDTGKYTIHTNKYLEMWRYNNFYMELYAYKKGSGDIVARSLYKPDIFVCACNKREECDLTYITNRTSAFRPTNSENYYLLPCNCPPDVSNRFCVGNIDVCATKPCGEHGECKPDGTKPSGYTCSCKKGYIGNGYICTLDDCPADNECKQLCSLDPVTAKPICSCKDGYVLNDDMKTCRDRNECNFPNSCPDSKAICHNTIGSYYCECESGYKPMKGPQRKGCLKAARTYMGSLTFDQFWDIQEKAWKSWDDSLSRPDNAYFHQIARQLEPLIEDLVKLMEPMRAELFTYVYQFSAAGKKIKVSYKIYPSQEIDTAMFASSLTKYIQSRKGEAAGLKGLDGVTFDALNVDDFCAASACNSPFATCHNADTEKMCSCNPGFVFNTDTTSPDTCNSYCKWKQCDKSTSYSCRDVIESGPQCLCKKGYTINAQNNCYKASPCPSDKNPCGKHGTCHDEGDGIYSCICEKGFIKAAKPSPDVCVPDVMIGRDNLNDTHPESVGVEEYQGFYKVVVPVGFPYFDHKHWKLFVSPFGLISLGKNITVSELLSYHPSTYGYIIAPFWSDFEWTMSKTHIQVFDATTSIKTEYWLKVIEEIRKSTVTGQESFAPFDMFGYRELKDPASFDPQTIIVVTWTDLVLKPFVKTDRVSMQVIIASDGVATVVMSNYDAASTTIKSWEDPKVEKDPELAYEHRGFVGFQGGDRQYCLNRVSFAESHSDCRSFVPSQLFESKGPNALPAGRFVFLVANDIGVSVEADRNCFEAMKEYQNDREAAIDTNYIYSALGDNKVDPCPWTETQVTLDSRFQLALSPDADKFCYVKKFVTKFTYPATGSVKKTADIRPYCCYKNNALLMQANSHTHMIIEKYAEKQAKIHSTCCLTAAHCPIANIMVPALFVAGYEPPVTAGVFGDPHMVTFAGFDVTFKGHGDYVLFNSSEISVHGRFDDLSAEMVNGAALMGVALKVGSYEKITTEISLADGALTFSVGGKKVDLTDPVYTKPSGFNQQGHIEATLDDSQQSVETIKVTYVDGLSFEFFKMPTQTKKNFYFHLRVRSPKQYLKAANTGLLSDFMYPDGTHYHPKLYETMFIGDEHYFYNYGRNWSVDSSQVAPLFDTNTPANCFVPSLFYEKYLIERPPDMPIFRDKCHHSVPCAYDYVATGGDNEIAQASYHESAVLHQRRQEEAEKPPTFGKNPYIWLINVQSIYTEFTPKLVDPGSDVRFSLDTDFPRHLITEFDPFSGKMAIIMTNEARDAFLNQGPFEFTIIATRGSTGVSTYTPVGVRICNCGEDKTCDWSDDLDALEVEVFPTVNKQRYSIVRCNCYSFQAGKFCESQYNACGTSPCFPGVPCFDLHISDFKLPSFSCGGCPFGYKGDGFHCVADNPCLNVKCNDGKVCQNVNGYGKCVCPPGAKLLPDGSCEFPNRCEQTPHVCIGEGQRCNRGQYGSYWCDCKPGYAPRYRKDSLVLELQSCEQASYTYVASFSFDKHYNANKDVETYTDALKHPETPEYQTFARRILYDLDNARVVLKSEITAVHIRDVRPIQPDNGFAIDVFAYSNTKQVPAKIQAVLAKYFSQTNNLGVIVNIRDPMSNVTFIDVCDSSAYSPCREIASPVGSCLQRGIPGEGPICKCNADLGYKEEKLPNGDYRCVDNCDSVCKGRDENAMCVRSGTSDAQTAGFACICTPPMYFNSTTTNKCEAYPNPCLSEPCGPNAFCISKGPNTHFCVCYPTAAQNASGVCVSHCELAGNCANVENSYGCLNMKGGYQCLCDPGHRWSDTTKTCDDIDECAEGLFTCPKHAKCVNKPGSYECQCEDEYTFGKDKSTCYVKKEKILYPFNFYNTTPSRETEAIKSYTIRGGFHYHDNFIHTVHVGFDGYLGLDAPPPFKYYGNVLSTHLVAPFWMDLDVLPNDPTSGLYIDSFDVRATLKPEIYAKWKDVFNLAIYHLQAQYPHSENPNLWNNGTMWMNDMLILTWVNVVPCPAWEYGKFHTTFQMVLGANSAFSFAIFNYLENPAEINWPTALKAPGFQPLMGHTVGTKEPRFESHNGDPPNYQEVFTDRSPQLRGRIVEAFGTPVEVFNRKCLLAYESYPKEIVDTLWGLDQPGSGLEQRNACPAFLNQMEMDTRWQPEYEIADSLCYGLSFWHEAVDMKSKKTFNVRSLCCYDTTSGAFLGYPHGHVSSFVQIKEFKEKQMAMFETCCIHSTYCEVFAAKNPTSHLILPENYDQPEIAYVRGDPHIGLPYHQGEKNRQITFNGRGEYTLIKALKLVDSEIQIRFSTRDQITQRGTFVTGIAMKSADGKVVEVINHNGELYVFKDGEHVDLTSLILPQSHPVVTDRDYDLWAADNFVGYVTANGISVHITEVDDAYFNIRISLPRYLANHYAHDTCGLLTSFEATPYLDCDGKQSVGDVLNNDLDAYKFGQEFKLKSKPSSLFSYKIGPSYDDVNNVPDDWKPMFQSDFVGSGPADLDDVCGVDKACIFDYRVTENKRIAVQTKQFGKEIMTMQSFSVMKRPTITNEAAKPVYLILSDKDKTSKVEIDTEEEANGTVGLHYVLFTNFDYERWYTFDNVTGAFSIVSTKILIDDVRQMKEAPFLRFVAVHEAATSLWAPPTWTCVCEKTDQCDTSYPDRQFYERPHYADHNYFMPCKCPPTARGRFCEISFDPCVDNPCGKETTCQRNETSPTGYSCGPCPPAFLSFEGICRPRICHEDTCTNGDCYVGTDGSLKCTCDLGYEPTPGNDKVCRDINECQLGRHDCYKYGPGFECINVPGAWTCGCKDGYAPDDDNDMTTCVLTPNQIVGRIKVSSVVLGIELIEWDDELSNHASERYKRVTRAVSESLMNWFTQDLHLQDIASVVIKRLTKGSIVIDYVVNPKKPIDAQEFEKAQIKFLEDGGAVEDLKGIDIRSIKVSADPCESDTTCDPVSTKCRWDSRGAIKHCDCRDGFVENPKSDRSCDDNCTNICTGQLGPNAKCFRSSAGYLCGCITNFFQEGGRCINKCDPVNPCKNGGSCAVAPGSSFVCQCVSNFFGPICESTCDCLNGGVCADPKEPTKCTCPEGYGGAKCADCATGYEKNPFGKCLSMCATKPCLNSGICAIVGGSRFCKCPTGYFGTNCEITCQCQNGGVCGDPTDVSKCTCLEGYSGDKCEKCAWGYKKDASGKCLSVCSSNPCLNGGVCSAKESTFACVCQGDFAGATCERCANGFILSTGTCKSKCTPNYCGANGDCVIKNGDAACVCKNKYIGEKCDQLPTGETERLTDDTDRQNLIIVSAVLGSVCFILLCVVLAFGCLVQKGKQEAKKRQQERRRSSSGSGDSVPEFPQRQQQAETTFTSAPPQKPVEGEYVPAPAAQPYAVYSQPPPVTVYSEPPVEVKPQISQLQNAAPPVSAPPASLLLSQPAVYSDVSEESEDF